MYSSRRSQIEHKVRAARQRTLAPGKRADKADKTAAFEERSDAGPTLNYEPSAYAGPPVALPPKIHSAPAQPAWDSGPVTTPAAATPTFNPPAPAPAPPPAPAYEPPPFEAPAAQPEWTPRPQAPPEPAAPPPAPAERAATSAGSGASWSIVGESKASAEPDPKKRSKQDAQTGAWSLASGEVAGDEPDEGPSKPSATIAIAQYAVLVIGLVMVLIGVVVMVANSHGS